ncbi:hypothetical protein [Wolbachia endosymbiont (group B) of Pammene fasciana]|uniref:hypothetical protein n=1 Tax=Wolbachia endosymbiont (group B) of Pammene fasciana TaxID=2954037 RepID=UPI00222F4263|nr:hypothetical protein [Wolbachia endosymbiont (group B) of Pammene fasciana]
MSIVSSQNSLLLSQCVAHNYFPSCCGVIPMFDTGMALLHHSRKEQAVTDGICYKIDI